LTASTNRPVRRQPHPRRHQLRRADPPANPPQARDDRSTLTTATTIEQPLRASPLTQSKTLTRAPHFPPPRQQRGRSRLQAVRRCDRRGGSPGFVQARARSRGPHRRMSRTSIRRLGSPGRNRKRRACRHQQGELPRPLTGALIVRSESLAFPNLEGARGTSGPPCSVLVACLSPPAASFPRFRQFRASAASWLAPGRC
jgi:hypothetical protein